MVTWPVVGGQDQARSRRSWAIWGKVRAPARRGGPWRPGPAWTTADARGRLRRTPGSRRTRTWIGRSQQSGADRERFLHRVVAMPLRTTQHRAAVCRARDVRRLHRVGRDAGRRQPLRHRLHGNTAERVDACLQQVILTVVALRREQQRGDQFADRRLNTNHCNTRSPRRATRARASSCGRRRSTGTTRSSYGAALHQPAEAADARRAARRTSQPERVEQHHQHRVWPDRAADEGRCLACPVCGPGRRGWPRIWPTRTRYSGRARPPASRAASRPADRPDVQHRLGNHTARWYRDAPPGRVGRAGRILLSTRRGSGRFDPVTAHQHEPVG